MFTRFFVLQGAEKLLTAGASIAATTRFGSTALHIAASYGHAGVCVLVLNYMRAFHAAVQGETNCLLQFDVFHDQVLICFVRSVGC